VHVNAFHAARMVAVEAAARSLLAEAQEDTPFDTPDGVSIIFSPEHGLEVNYTRDGVAVGGEGL
jgi:hypothetical protein